jgi:hypothetical protein
VGLADRFSPGTVLFHLLIPLSSMMYCGGAAVLMRATLCCAALARIQVEQEVELTYKQALEQRCSSERMQQQQLYRFGQKERARQMSLKHCDEISERFGHRYMQYTY